MRTRDDKAESPCPYRSHNVHCGMPKIQLSKPSPDACSHSHTLAEAIAGLIRSRGGTISFAEYMEAALYWPGLGYYSAGSQKFGAAGDFVTAPEISPLFAACLAEYCHRKTEDWADYDLVEFGAGSGQLAIDLLPRLDPLPKHYYILELSAELRERQQIRIREALGVLAERVIWLDQPPQEPLNAIVIANEVLDAMPVEKFRWTAGKIERGIVRCDPEWREDWEISTNPEFETAINHLELSNELEHYESEINLWIEPWLAQIAAWLGQGEILLIDYGFLRHEYYHPQRSMGTLRCHYRHHHHDDVFFYPGLQDITAHVDFTAVELAAQSCGFTVAGYSTQAEFLLAHGLLEHAASENPKEQFAHANSIKLLTLPSEMGELFKVMALRRTE